MRHLAAIYAVLRAIVLLIANMILNRTGQYLTFWVLAGGAALAQVSPDLEQGMKPYGSYQGGNLDHISMTNGNLFFLADLLAYSQRGGELGYRIVLQYNNENFNVFQYTCPAGTKANQCPMYLVFGPPWASTNVSRGNSVTIGVEVPPSVIAAGARTNTGLSLNGQPIYVQLYSVLTSDGSLHTLASTGSGQLTADGSAFFVDSSGTLHERSGTKYLSNGIAEDANGNQINYSTGADTVNRQIPPMPGPQGNFAITSVSPPPASTASLSACPALGYTNQAVSYAYTWNLPTVNGGTLPLTLCYASIYVNTTGGDSDFFHGVHASFAMLQSAVFPDNTYWAFQYDAGDPNNSSLIAMGDLLKITFPGGGSISYTWAACSCSTNFARSVMTRSVDANDGTGAKTWQYFYSSLSTVNGNPTQYTTIQDPVGNQTVHTMTGLGGFSALYETQVQYYQGSQSSGTLLKTVKTDYQYTLNPYDSSYISGGGDASITNVFPIHVTTTLPNGLVTKTETDYDTALAYHGPLDGIQYNYQSCYNDNVTNPNDQNCFWTPTYTMPVTNYTGSYGKVIATREYDWGQGAPGPLLRQTSTSYLWQSNSNYLNNNFLDLVSSSTIMDGSGNQVAQTTYGYDEYLLNSSGINTQRNANPVTGNVRGNQTSVHRWLNGSSTSTPNCAVSVNNGFLVSYVQYNDTGTVNQSTDACGIAAGDINHRTTHSYDPAYAGGYSTRTCNPLGQCVNGTYDFNTGLLTSFTDANSQTTTYYYDNRWRMTQAVFPLIDNSGIHPETDFYYYNLTTIQRCKKKDSSSGANCSNWIQDYAYFDGLGRMKQTRLVEPIAGNDDYVDTTYDAAGRVSTVSNPHRSASGSTDGITTGHYDALGRVTQVTKQDGSNSTVQYDLAVGNSNCTLATDDAGKQRKACSDVLGRLTSVWEDPSGLNYETDYQYDTLGNLLRVDQKGSAPGDSAQWRTRLFTYDSLSRLLTANNPESGQISYSYDADGNVLTKTDARGVITSYSYDQLNRLTQKSYSDDTTPASSYVYDQANPWGWSIAMGNPIGRLVAVNTGGATGVSRVFSYDALGRATTEWQCLGNCPAVSSTYDLRGEMTSLTYPDGQIVNYTYNTAGQPLSATGADNTAYVSNATYYPTGVQYQQWSPNVYARTDLNNRLQMAGFYADNGVSLVYMNKSYSYGAQNNGNIVSITNNKDNARTQSFSYDSLNRLTHAESAGTDCSQVLPDGHTEYWGNNYVYDAWGNLYQKNVTKCSAENLQKNATAQNRLAGYGYDAGGNMTSDGLHSYSYDAESRISQVDSGATTYVYDSEGERVRKTTTSNLAWTEYVSFGGNTVAERSTVSLNAGMFSQSGLSGYNAAQIADGNTGCCGWHTDSATPGAWLQVNLGSGNQQAVTGLRIYDSTPNYAGNWTVQYSDDTATWSTVITNFVPNQQGWNSMGWNSAGAHRYWRLYLTNTPGPGSWLNELQLIVDTNYAYFNGKRVGRRDPSGAVHYYLSDHLGSTSMLVSAAGAIESESEYYPWGGELKFSRGGDDGNHYKFTGKERDSETGFDYFGARYYGNTLGRFMTPDWSVIPVPVPYAILNDPQSLNLYSYVRNIPTINVDRDGHQSLDAQRQAAVREAWRREQELVKTTGEGTRKWTMAEKVELIKTGKVGGYVGHHINSVNGNPQLAAEPRNIEFVKGQGENLARHGGNFRNPTSGEMLNRAFIGMQVIGMLARAWGDYKFNQHESETGLHSDALFGVRITNVDKAAQILEPGTQSKYGDEIFILGGDHVWRNWLGDTLYYDPKDDKNHIKRNNCHCA